MQESDTNDRSGPESGLSEAAFEQTLRDATALLADDSERPDALFLAMQYGNGTDYVHAHSEATDSNLDRKVEDLFSPLAVHVRAVAEAANSDPETVLECVSELLESVERSETTGDVSVA